MIPETKTLWAKTIEDKVQNHLSKIKNPQTKKELHYEKDHLVRGGQHDKAFRKIWPKKKATANRQYRRQTNQEIDEAQRLLQKASNLEIIDDLDTVTNARIKKSVPRKHIVKWGVATVREVIKRKLSRRGNDSEETNS